MYMNINIYIYVYIKYSVCVCVCIDTISLICTAICTRTHTSAEGCLFRFRQCTERASFAHHGCGKYVQSMISCWQPWGKKNCWCQHLDSTTKKSPRNLIMFIFFLIPPQPEAACLPHRPTRFRPHLTQSSWPSKVIIHSPEANARF